MSPVPFVHRIAEYRIHCIAIFTKNRDPNESIILAQHIKGSMEKNLHEIEKKYSISLKQVCEILPKKDRTGHIIEYNFLDEIKGLTGLEVSRYGKGPFCRFSVPSGYAGKTGVYFIYDNVGLKYIGECVNLETRFNMGYGIIELRNCLVKGQHTNCRINNLVLQGVREGNRFFLFFTESQDRKNLEDRLISDYHPPWNRTHRNNPLTPPSPVKKIYSPGQMRKTGSIGKYQALFNRLAECNNDEDIVLRFSEIESLLGFKLPPSAYKYQAWWANDIKTHSHAKAWLNAGWKTVQIQPGISVKFSKSVLLI
jgi:hypothetical protein